MLTKGSLVSFSLHLELQSYTPFIKSFVLILIGNSIDWLFFVDWVVCHVSVNCSLGWFAVILFCVDTENTK